MNRTETRQHLLEVHHMPGLLYAGLDPERVHLEAHRTAARNVLEAKYGTDGMVTEANVEMVAQASIAAECQMRGCRNTGTPRPVYDANPDRTARKQIGTVTICEPCQDRIDTLNAKQVQA